MTGEDRDEDGRYTETYPDEAFFSAINEVDVASTQNIADAVGCSYDLAYHRLKQLEDAGEVESREVRNAFVWLRKQA
jgi:GTP-sensing pleiotropic transcriptional regulator CodY